VALHLRCHTRAMSFEDVSGRPDDLRRADDANRGIPHDPHEQATTEIIAST